MHLRTGDDVWRALARRWSKMFAVLFAVGAVSGTIISFELGLLWPRFMAYAGGIIGLPFSLEGAAFFIEAIFVGIYLYGWDRLSPRLHWLSGIPIALASVGSAFFIFTANAWMNAPRGFQLDHGHVTHVDPLAAMFNPAWATETSHMVLGAYLATAFGVAAVYAVGMLRGHRDAYHRKAIAVAMSSAAILAPLQVGVGDLLGRTVAHNQPAKLAAIEGVNKTERGAGLNVGGIPVPGHVPILNVKVPHLLSVLAFDRPNATVRGLNSFPKADRPPLTGPVRLAFIGMVGIGTGLVGIGLFYWLRRRLGGPGPEDRIIARLRDAQRRMDQRARQRIAARRSVPRRRRGTPTRNPTSPRADETATIASSRWPTRRTHTRGLNSGARRGPPLPASHAPGCCWAGSGCSRRCL